MSVLGGNVSTDPSSSIDHLREILALVGLMLFQHSISRLTVSTRLVSLVSVSAET